MPGLPKAIIKKYGVSKKAWEVFRSGGGSRSKPKLARRTRFRYVTRSAPRRRSRFGGYLRRRARKGTQIPIPLVAATLYPVANAAINGYGAQLIKQGDFAGGVGHILGDVVTEFTGYSPFDGHFDMKFPLKTWTPIVLTALLHQFIGRRVNPYIKRIPMVGKWIGV